MKKITPGTKGTKRNSAAAKEIDELCAKVRELEETLEAIRSGEVDAIVVTKGDTRKIYTLEGTDLPYRALVENIQEGALTLSRTGIILYTNSRFADMVNMSPDNVAGTSILDHICPEYCTKIDEAMQAITKRAGRIRARIRQGSGSLPVLISMNPLGPDEDTKISVVVTDRRNDEEQLQLQVRMLDAVGDAVIAADANQKIIYWNAAATKTYGWKPEEVLGRDIVDVATPEISKNQAREIAARLMKGESWSGRYEVRHRDGHLFPIHASDVPLFDDDGKLLAIIGASHDITEQKQVEEVYRETNQYLDNLMNYANAPIIVWDPAFRITRFNHAFEQLTGMVAGEAIGQHLSVVFPGAFRDAAMDVVRRTMGGERLNVVELPILRKGGEVRVVLWNSANLYEPDEKTISSTIAQGQDITERKLAEEELRLRHNDLSAAYAEISSTQEELRHNVEKLSLREQELLRSEANLKEALTEKEILLSEIHHRVKNNLAAFISLLSLDGTYEETDAGRILRNDLQNRARSMALIHETLYRTGKFSVVDMETYLTTLLRQIAGTYAGGGRIQTVVDARGITLDLARATTAGLIINELVTNSFKYAFPPGFDCTNVRREPCTIMVTCTEKDGTHFLTIADNGQGIPADLDPLAAKSLGLRLVNFLARHQLGAEIAVRQDKGTEFIFRLNKKEGHA